MALEKRVSDMETDLGIKWDVMSFAATSATCRKM